MNQKTDQIMNQKMKQERKNMNQDTKKINQDEPSREAVEIIAKELKISEEDAKKMIEKHSKKSGTLLKAELVSEIEKRTQLEKEDILKVIDSMAHIIGEAVYRDRRSVKVVGFISIITTARKLTGAIKGVGLFTNITISKTLRKEIENV
jgi:nucleoid DNA-binding protein